MQELRISGLLASEDARRLSGTDIHGDKLESEVERGVLRRRYAPGTGPPGTLETLISCEAELGVPLELGMLLESIITRRMRATGAKML